MFGTDVSTVCAEAISQSEDTRPPHRKLIGESTGHRSDGLIKYEKDNEKVQTNVSPNTRFLRWNRQQ